MMTRSQHFKKWYAKNKDKDNANSRAWRAANPERVKELNQKNKDKRKESTKKWRLANPDKVKQHRRTAKLKYQYNLTVDDYHAMWLSQDGKCAICEKLQEINGKSLVVDHGHIKNNIRSLLCHNCNAGLGLFQDRSIILKKAAEYLVKHEEDNLV